MCRVPGEINLALHDLLQKTHAALPSHTMFCKFKQCRIIFSFACGQQSDPDTTILLGIFAGTRHYKASSIKKDAGNAGDSHDVVDVGE